MKTIDAAMTTHLAGTVTSLASLWRLTRTDDQEFYFTDHDVEITFDDGDGVATYLPQNGYSRTAISNSVGLNVDNVDIIGLFSTDQIKEDELRAGLFDYAKVRASFVNWDDLTMGNIKIRKGRLGEVLATTTGTFQAELRGMAQDLSIGIVDTYAPECRADLGDAQCGIPIRPNILSRSTAISLGTFYRVVTLSTTGITYPTLFYNKSFERGTTGDDQVPTDWTATGVWDLETGTVDGLAPDDGSNFLRGGSASGILSQTVLLSTLGILDASVDAGDLNLDFSIKRANTDVDDTGRVLVEYLDSFGAPISVAYDSGIEVISPVDTWVIRSVIANAVPATTRSIKVTLTHTLVTGIQSDSCFDNIVIDLNDTVVTNVFQEIYENRVYEVTTAGTTAGSQPSYDTIIGNPTTDGTAILTARDSFSRDAKVEDIITSTKMNIAISDSRAVDDWFNGGVVVFDSGPNATRAYEIRDWDQSTGEVNLYLAVPFATQPGNSLHIYPGCDKRIDICNTRFANAINFRGEPHVPGSDSLTEGETSAGGL